MNEIHLPVIKAWKWTFDLLGAIYENGYNRFGFQNAVLDLFPGKSTKSVFRGMAVPTLRGLGFIIGFDENIRISSNGALVHIANLENREEGIRALRATLLEFDSVNRIISFLESEGTVSLQYFVNYWTEFVEISDSRVSNSPEKRQRAAIERIKDWVNYLAFAELLVVGKDMLRIESITLRSTKDDLNADVLQKRMAFEELLFRSYHLIVKKQRGVRTVEIDSLRREVAICTYNENKLIVTEKQFDTLLSDLPKSTDQYSMSFGRSMGADENLFVYRGKYYQTIIIREFE